MNDQALQVFKANAKTPVADVGSDEDIQLRLVTRFVNEAVYCLQVIELCKYFFPWLFIRFKLMS